MAGTFINEYGAIHLPADVEAAAIKHVDAILDLGRGMSPEDFRAYELWAINGVAIGFSERVLRAATEKLKAEHAAHREEMERRAGRDFPGRQEG